MRVAVFLLIAAVAVVTMVGAGSDRWFLPSLVVCLGITASLLAKPEPADQDRPARHP
jgi:hypothetical protein